MTMAGGPEYRKLNVFMLMAEVVVCKSFALVPRTAFAQTLN
jgi:hypothetical protein